MFTLSTEEEMNSHYSIENSFSTTPPGRLLFRLAPPVMLAFLIQALYNIVDSYFVGKNSDSGLTALSLIYPIQLLMTALGIGTGVGVNTLIARFDGEKNEEAADGTARTGSFLGLMNWLAFTVVIIPALCFYLRYSSDSESIRRDAAVYGYIVCLGSLGLFMESIWTKILQARGNMTVPLLAQTAGAALNIILDPLLIFGMHGFPRWGVAGAAVATVVGQFAAAVVTGIAAFKGPASRGQIRKYTPMIYKNALPSIVMQSLWTFYIFLLNLILTGFGPAAVIVLGLYYKLQTFFFIPLFGLQNCIVPLISFNYAAGLYSRCKRILFLTLTVSAAFMGVGIVMFTFMPARLLQIFTDNRDVIAIGIPAFRIIAVSFVPVSLSLTLPLFFQAVGKGKESIAVTVVRQIFLLAPLGYLLSLRGLTAFWLTFPLSDTLTVVFGLVLLRRVYKDFMREDAPVGSGS